MKWSSDLDKGIPVSRRANQFRVAIVSLLLGALLASVLRRREHVACQAPVPQKRGHRWRRIAFDRVNAVVGTAAAVMGTAATVVALVFGQQSLTVMVSAAPSNQAVTSPRPTTNSGETSLSHARATAAEAWMAALYGSGTSIGHTGPEARAAWENLESLSLPGQNDTTTLVG
jgi:hypothetical protein